MRLNRDTLHRLPLAAARCLSGPSSDHFPERMLQFGEGNFLRCFAGWMVNTMNARGLFNGRIVVVQPIEDGMVGALNEQDGLYTVVLRGVQGSRIIERREIVTAVSRGINPYADWRGFLDTASQPELRFVVSNTTEAGIAYVEEPRPSAACPRSFPAKVAAWLAERFRRLGGSAASGIIFLPCELIDRNGDALKACVLRHAEAWGLGHPFIRWLTAHNRFLNTLVDRIVPGYPQDEAAKLTAELGYEDRLLTAGEIFHTWVIEADERIAVQLPLTTAGLSVVWTADLAPYRLRKVRILNGAHTMTALAAFLAGLDTVQEAVSDPLFGRYLRKGIFQEILTLPALPRAGTRVFAESVLERLANPFIRHRLQSIALNSVSKYRVRVLPSLLEYWSAHGRLPAVLTFSLAALLAFYRGTEIREGGLQAARAAGEYTVKDEPDVLAACAEAWGAFERHRDPETVCRRLLARADFWGEDLAARPLLVDVVAAHLADILRGGVGRAVRALL
jgi:tagaturonate reductase